MTLEKVLVRRLTEDVRSGVEAYYLTYGLPKEFGDEVMYVRDVKLVRKDYTVRVRIWDHETEAENVNVEIQVSYTVINYSTEDQEYHQRMEVDQPEAGTARIVRISRGGADLSDERVRESPGSKVNDLLHVRPNSKDPHNTFDYVVRKVFARQYGSDVVIMSMPAVNMRLTLEEIPEDLAFDVTIGHRAHRDVKAMPEADPRMWRLDKAFFPGAGIGIVWWKKKPPAE
jgi:hypothetical protein